MNKRQNLYKYLCPEGAIKSLQNSTILFRKPRDFNDPFDIQPSTLVNVTAEDLCDYSATKLVKEFKDGSVREKFGLISHPALAHFVAERTRELSKASEVQLRGLFYNEEALNGWAGLLQETVNDLKRGFDNSFVSCFTENRSSLLMWAHYSKSHTGALLKFRKNPQSELGLISNAKRVIYSRRPPVLASKRDWFRFLQDPHSAKFENEKILQVLMCKSREWSYEKEWRLVVLPQELELYEHFSNGFFSFDPIELEAVFLGHKIGAETKKEIIEICRSRYPRADIFASCKAKNKFKILYEPLEFTL